jgi:hypothetical protein
MLALPLLWAPASWPRRRVLLLSPPRVTLEPPAAPPLRRVPRRTRLAISRNYIVWSYPTFTIPLGAGSLAGPPRLSRSPI